ncbi:hypothetical protein BUALT_Bualt12G0048900 [Buddleja alternifolia]|uniref:3'-5' exonuclease domain-containing protein n=1 Tax=Buddleja alternifolia TaxID=168488 RepID=A0AAV6WZA8_9LAMI|nr:hypothetical protein BUALT_Bualt12G0048900 [Buddleja alternifolia]
MASYVLSENVEKPRLVTMSNWNERWLTAEQVKILQHVSVQNSVQNVSVDILALLEIFFVNMFRILQHVSVMLIIAMENQLNAGARPYHPTNMQLDPFLYFTHPIEDSPFNPRRDKAVDVYDLARLKNAGLKELASYVLSEEDVEKPRRVTMSNWDERWLTAEQVKYACVDAYLSYEIGWKLDATLYEY